MFISFESSYQSYGNEIILMYAVSEQGRRDRAPYFPFWWHPRGKAGKPGKCWHTGVSGPNSGHS